MAFTYRLDFIFKYSIATVIKFSNEKVASLDGDNLVALYYLSASEIWLDKRGGLGYGV